ncbi:MAG: TolC family protein [Bacteroidales bacterium]|nr:TolC family protein [Bacteroidales bacterium]
MKYIIIICLELLSFVRLLSQDTLSLEMAIVKGLQNNYQIRISDKLLEINRNNNSWGAAGRYPTINFNTSATGIANRYVSQELAYIADTLGVNTEQRLSITPTINLNWVIFDGFAVNITKSKLDDLERLSEGNSAIVIESALQSIIIAYHNSLLQQEALGVLNEVKKLSRDRYSYILARKQLGNSVTFDVLQAQNNYLTDSAGAINQELNLKNSLRNLNFLLAESAEKDYILKPEATVEENEFILGDLISKLENSNRTLQNQYINQEILTKELKYSKSSLYPSLSLTAGFGRTFSGLYGDLEQYTEWDHNGYQATGGLTLSYLLSSGGNVRRAIQNARIQMEIGEIQIEEIRQKLYNQLFNTLEQYNIKKQLLHVANASVESAALNLQIAEEKFKSGAINSFNYRDIQLIYLEAVRAQLLAHYNLVVSYTELLRLTGGIITEYE